MKAWIPIAAASLAAAILPANATAAKETVLYSFQGGAEGSTDGANPRGGLIFDASGNLYGTTEFGGLLNEGTVFELAPAPGAWTETQIFNFTITCQGGNCQRSTGTLPLADLAFDANGNLYGAASSGGKYGNGTLFQLTPPTTGSAWTETIAHNFTGGSDGAIPLGGVLIVDRKGTLMGTAGGGSFQCGVVFELTPAVSGTGWTGSVLHAFSCTPDGGSPQGDLIHDAAGNVYGTTLIGGTGNCFDGCGTVYMLSPPALPGGAWTETVLYSFLGSPDGIGPWAGLVRDAAGNLYGTTYRGGQYTSACYPVGCGTVFELSPPGASGGAWTETVIHNFTGGDLYGTASAGGDLNCNSGGWTETVLHAFTGAPDGDYPQFALALKNDALYGTTVKGGSGPNGGGTVFEVVP
jgi:uncharacterized repeat protein (TIGR03803 family)